MVHPRPSRRSAEVCWRCQWRIFNRRHAFERKISMREGVAPNAVPQSSRRDFHSTRPRTHAAVTAAPSLPSLDPPFPHVASQRKMPIRQHLQLWQHELGGPDEETLKAFENHPARDDVQNGMSKLSYSAKADEDLGEAKFEANEDNVDDELITIGLFLKPGDVVELSQPGREPVLAVFVQQLDLTSQFFSSNGRWCHSHLRTITFAVPGCIDPALLQPLIPFLPTKPQDASPKDPVHVPQDAANPILEMLEQLTAESEKIYRTNAPVLDTAYSTLADPTRTRMMTLAQIAKTLLAKSDPTWTPSPPSLLAVRKALNHDAFRFSSDVRSQRLTNVFAIRPKNDVDVVETVQEWIREYREFEALLANKDHDIPRWRSRGATYVAEFISKAHRLISISRKHREPHNGFIGRSQSRSALNDRSSVLKVIWGEDFTQNDRQIINFLQAWVLTRQFSDMPNLHSACTSILHATGCYENMSVQTGFTASKAMGRATGQLFLQEIGVITPHENRELYDEQLMLPTVRLSRNLELLSTKAELTRRNPDFRDSMADLRRDWGSTTVYCVDAADAKEIDDGVSIEKVPENDECWIHVHVANPTAFFDKTHVLSGLAAHMTETVYTPERSFPMLPNWASQNYFSLDKNRPVITFSSRIDPSGSILESKIQHGIIRKVLSITPNQLAAFLGENSTSDVIKLVVGGDVPAAASDRPPPRLSRDQLQDLQDLYMAAQALWRGRKAAGGLRMGSMTSNVQLYETSNRPGLTWMPPSTERARLIHGDPVIELTARKSGNSFQQGIDASNIIEEMMLLACRSAASWCAERNIPVMFRGTVEPPSQTLSLEQFQQKVVMPYLEKHGTLSPGVGFRYVEALGRAIAHSAPLPHRIIGTQAYLKVTSPLRRFSDMIAHWQIEAALRYEARAEKKLNLTLSTTTSRPVLPFSQRQMQESIITLSPRERIITATKRHSTHFWAVQAFFRAFYYKEAALPDSFVAVIRFVHSPGLGAMAYLSDFSMKVTIQDHPDTPYQVGDQWEVKIDLINMFTRSIFVQPVHLLHRDEELM